MRPFASTLLTHLFKHIPSHLTSFLQAPPPPAPNAPRPDVHSTPPPTPPQTCMLYFAVGFLLVEMFPRECEEAQFTRRLIQSALTLAPAVDTPISVVYCVSYNSFDSSLFQFDVQLRYTEDSVACSLVSHYHSHTG